MKTSEERKNERTGAIGDLRAAIRSAEAGDADKAAFQATRAVRRLRRVYRAQLRYT